MFFGANSSRPTGSLRQRQKTNTDESHETRREKDRKILTDVDQCFTLRVPCVASLRTDRHQIGMTDRHHRNPHHRSSDSRFRLRTLKLATASGGVIIGEMLEFLAELLTEIIVDRPIVRAVLLTLVLWLFCVALMGWVVGSGVAVVCGLLIFAVFRFRSRQGL